MSRIATTPRNRHETEQSVGTPPDFFSVVDAEFGFGVDLAADAQNTKCQYWISESDDSLKQTWAVLNGWLWLNPPFSDMEPWARKCWEESQQGAKIVMLALASVGTHWFRNWVWGKCEIRFLNSRVKFIGHSTGIAKDLMLCIYERGRFPSVGPWDWKAKLPKPPFFTLSSPPKSPDSPKIESHQNSAMCKDNLNPVEGV